MPRSPSRLTAGVPQRYPDGLLPGRLWMALLGVSAGLVVLATLIVRWRRGTALLRRQILGW
jgi:hypothetical protein